MQDRSKTKAQLVDELTVLRRELRELKTAYQILTEEKIKYETFIQNVNDDCFETDLNGQVVFRNKALMNLLGYKPGEYAKLPFRDRYETPEEAQRVFRIFNEIYRTGEPRIFYSKLRKKHGGVVAREVQASLVRDAEGKPLGFRGIGRDVTERMKLEAEQARYRNFLENIDEFCVESDLAGKLTFFNDAFCRVLESSAEEIKNSTYDKYYSENMAKELYQLYNNVYKTGQPARTYDFKMTFRDGRILYLDMTVSLVRDSDGNPIGFRAVSRDVTERVKAEENLKRYKEFVENVEDACFETDLRGRFTFANHAVSRQSGYSREEFLSLPPEGLYVSKEARNRVRPVFREVLETGIPKKVVYQLQRKNGEIYSVENVISLMRDNKGNPVGYRGITRDVTERIKNEQALERYRDFLDSIDELCWENDLNGKLIFANQKALHVFGFDDKEELQRYGSTQEERLKAKVSYQTYLSPGNRERFYKMYLDVYESGESKVFYNTQVLRQGGGRDYYDINISLIRDEEGKPTGFRSFSRDVTERFKTEQERERYREFIENIDDGCYEQDLQGNYTFVNEAACRRFGYTRDEFIGMNYSTMMSQETAKKMFALFNEVYRNGRTSDLIDFEIFTKNKKILHMQTMASLIWDHEGNPIGFRGISRDVTERFKMEKEQERYRNFLDNINDFCFERDLNGKMIFANEKWLKFFGITLEQTQQGGMGYHNFLTRETADKYDQIYMDVYRTGNPVDLYNFEMTFQDRESIYIDTSISLIRDENAKPTGFRVIARDVTRRKKMEDEREKLREKIVQSEKLESIGTLAGGIAHDFNNLLMGIQGYTSLMLMDIDPSHPFYEQLKIIESQVKNGADLTKQLLGYARRGRYEMKATNMNDLVKKTSYMFGRTKKDIRIHQNYADELWEIEADPGQMEQVFLNLFVNASEAMSGGGAIHLQSENVMLDEQYVKPHDIEPGRYIKISVTDTGVGMDEKTRERIFEPFFTTKDMGKGVGLGLASVYGIVKGHRGIINCYSEKGHGTTFNIYLPALTENNKFDEQAETNTMVNKQINILLVDDERTITDVTGTMLARLGYQVIIAHGGQEAVLTYRVNRDRIDLVIMDMIMPDMGGGDAIEKIKAINPEIKIILCSGYSINGMAREIIERAGVQGFLQKPFQVDQLIDKINEVMTSS